MPYIITLIMSVVKINKKTHWNMLLILSRYKNKTDAWETLKTQWSKEKGKKKTSNIYKTMHRKLEIAPHEPTHVRHVLNTPFERLVSVWIG